MTDTLLYRSVSVQHNAQRQRRDTNTQRSSRRGLGGADPLAREREAPRLWRCLRVTVAGTGREGWRPSRARCLGRVKEPGLRRRRTRATHKLHVNRGWLPSKYSRCVRRDRNASGRPLCLSTCVRTRHHRAPQQEAYSAALQPHLRKARLRSSAPSSVVSAQLCRQRSRGQPHCCEEELEQHDRAQSAAAAD